MPYEWKVPKIVSGIVVSTSAFDFLCLLWSEKRKKNSEICEGKAVKRKCMCLLFLINNKGQ